MARQRVKPDPELSRRYRLLESAALKLGLKLRVERLSGTREPAPARSGLCRIGPDWIVFIDRNEPLEDRILTLVRALTQVADETVFLPPAIRAMMEELLDQSPGE